MNLNATFRRKLSTRASLVSDPIHIDVEFITVLGSYVDEDNEDTSRLLAKFFSLFVNDCSLLESHEVDNFILRNSAVLSSWSVSFLHFGQVYTEHNYLVSGNFTRFSTMSWQSYVQILCYAC